MINRRSTIIFLLTFLLLSFLIMPVIEVYAIEAFSDGFETGDLSNWTGTNKSTSEETVEVSSSQSASGSYSLHTRVNASYRYAYVYKDPVNTSDLTISYVQLKVYFVNVPGSWQVHSFLHARYSGGSIYILYLTKPDSSSALRLRLRTYHPSTTDYDYVYSFQTGVWYTFEVKFVSSETDGEYRVWLNGTQIISATGLNTSSASGLRQIQVGQVSTVQSSSGAENYIDDVKVNDSYIGTSNGGSSSSSLMFGTIEASVSTVYYGENFNLSAIVSSSSNTDFTNATLNLGSNIILGWTNSTNTFYKVSDPSNYVQLYSGSKTVVNSSSLRLTWIINFFNTFPEGNVDVNGTVFDGSGNNATKNVSNLFYVTSKPSGGSSSPSPTPTPSPEPGGETPLPPKPDVPVAPSVGTEVPAGVVVAVCCFAAAGYLLYHDRKLRRFKSLKVTRRKWRSLRKRDLEIVWEKIKEWE